MTTQPKTKMADDPLFQQTVAEAKVFETNLKELEKITRRMEGADVPLDESLLAFERGMELVESCRKQLEDVSMKVEKIIGAHGKTEPLDV